MSTIVSAVPEAEFVDLAGLKSGWGIGRGLAYQLLKGGQIRTVNLRQDGRTRGKRLVEVASVRKYISSFAGDIDPRLSKQLRRTRLIGVEKERKRKSK